MGVVQSEHAFLSLSLIPPSRLSVVQMGKADKAMMYFSWALDLEPKVNNFIKEVIDKYDAGPSADDADMSLGEMGEPDNSADISGISPFGSPI